MSWYAPAKQAALDPDNPTADEQFPFSEHNAMVAYLKDKIINKAIDQTDIANEKILVYKSATDNFVFEAQNEITGLNDIPDVVISGVPADKEVLAYNLATYKFINQTAAEAGLALVANVVLEADFNATTFLYATADNTPQPKTIAETLAILDVESGADVTDATNVAAAGAVLEADFNATTFLYATADDTPQPKTRAEVMAILSGSAGAEFLFNTQKIGGIVDPTTAQQAATKNYSDTNLYGYPILAGGPMMDGYVLAYDATNGRFEMVAQSAALGLPVADTTAIVKGSANGSRKMRFEVDDLANDTTRVLTVQDKDYTIADKAEVMLLNGTQAMIADLDMGAKDILNARYIQAASASGTALYASDGSYVMQIGLVGSDVRSYMYKLLVMQATLNMLGETLDNVGRLILNYPTKLTISSGIVTCTQKYHTIDTEGAVASDDLHTINGGTVGEELIIRAADSARTIVCNDSGDLRLEGDMILDNAEDTLSLIYDGTNWLETSRSNNGA